MLSFAIERFMRQRVPRFRTSCRVPHASSDSADRQDEWSWVAALVGERRQPLKDFFKPTCCRLQSNASCDSESQGFERLVEFHTQVLIVLIDRMNGLGWPPLSANDASHQGLDDLIAKNGVAPQLSDTVDRKS